MFNSSDIEKYRHIKAPAELKQSIMLAAENTPKKRIVPNVKAISAFAACLLIVIMSTVLLRTPMSPVTVTVNEAAVANTSTRMQASVILEIECDGKITVQTDSEGFYVFNSSKKEQKPLDGVISGKNYLEIVWLVSEDNGILTINGKLYEVRYIEADGKVEIVKK